MFLCALDFSHRHAALTENGFCDRDDCIGVGYLIHQSSILKGRNIASICSESVEIKILPPTYDSNESSVIVVNDNSRIDQPKVIRSGQKVEIIRGKNDYKYKHHTEEALYICANNPEHSCSELSVNGFCHELGCAGVGFLVKLGSLLNGTPLSVDVVIATQTVHFLPSGNSRNALLSRPREYGTVQVCNPYSVSDKYNLLLGEQAVSLLSVQTGAVLTYRVDEAEFILRDPFWSGTEEHLIITAKVGGKRLSFKISQFWKYKLLCEWWIENIGLSLNVRRGGRFGERCRMLLFGNSIEVFDSTDQPFLKADCRVDYFVLRHPAWAGTSDHLVIWTERPSQRYAFSLPMLRVYGILKRWFDRDHSFSNIEYS